MNLQEKEVTFQTAGSYSTLNSISNSTKNIWFVCHGMGYLSRYFLKYFASLNPLENYVIAPQAPSKYYLTPKFKRVGASWLTKENTLRETENIMHYFDAIFEFEQLKSHHNLIVMGYSQGVSVALRYIAKRQLNCSQIAIMSGGIPKELEKGNFSFLSPKTKVYLTYGNNDPYLDKTRILEEKNRASLLFKHCNLQIVPFEGAHEVHTALITRIGT